MPTSLRIVAHIVAPIVAMFPAYAYCLGPPCSLVSAIVMSGPIMRVGDEMVFVLPRSVTDAANLRDGQSVFVTIRTDVLN